MLLFLDPPMVNPNLQIVIVIRGGRDSRRQQLDLNEMYSLALLEG